MILLLGATSYVGQGFARALRRRKDSFIPLSRNAFDYTRFEFLFDYVRKIKPDLVINAADRFERHNGDSNELDRAEMLKINTLLPQTIARVCAVTNIQFGHVSSGSIFSGAKIPGPGGFRIEEDFAAPAVRALLNGHAEQVCGFSELDEPNCSFNTTPCSFYSGTKALAEEALRNSPAYIWRLRLPFNELDDPHNFLSQLQDGLKIHDAVNSVSHLDECIAACLELWDRRAPLGIYNVVNPGPVRTQELTHLIQHFLKPSRRLELLVYDDEAASVNERGLRSDCVLDTSKLVGAGIKMRSARHALEYALQKWVPQPPSAIRTLA